LADENKVAYPKVLANIVTTTIPCYLLIYYIEKMILHERDSALTLAGYPSRR
jgi:hypothetical protein